VARSVHARLDSASEDILDRLHRQTGRSESELVREGLRLLAQSRRPPRAPKVIGLGRFASGKSDLGSNKRHLRGFGKS
jgi:hypothetical protein